MPPDDIDLTVVVPTYKEADNIEPLVERIFKATATAQLSAELIIVDDDSRDGTEEQCARLSRSHNVRLITRRGERGRATAVLLGLRQAKGRFLLSMDADLSHPPESIPDFVRALEGGADFVLGSRYVPGAGIEEGWGLFRWMNSRIAKLLARPLAAVCDPLSGYFAMPRSAFLRSSDLSPLGYELTLELLVKSHPNTVVELPIYFSNRAAGKSKLSLRVQLQYLEHLRRLYTDRSPFLIQLIPFLLVGSLGVVVDVAVYSGLQAAFGINHLLARTVAFVAAATHNWFLNRHYTFLYGQARPPARQWLTYLGVMLGGLLINVGTYAALTIPTAPFAYRRYTALLTGIVLGATCNFIAARSYVFQKPRSSAAASS
jgi:dolichol-phosphate mannosyltransferase